MISKKEIQITYNRYHIIDKKKYIVQMITDSTVGEDEIRILLDQKKLLCKITSSQDTVIDRDTVQVDRNLETQWLIEVDLPQGYEHAGKLKVQLLQEKNWNTICAIDIRVLCRQQEQQYHQIAECEFQGDMCIVHGECALLQPVTVQTYTSAGDEIPAERTWLPRAEARCYYPEYGYIMYSDYQLRFACKDMDRIQIRVTAGDMHFEQLLSLKQKKREWSYRLAAEQSRLGKLKYYGYRFLQEAGDYTIAQWNRKLRRRLEERRYESNEYYMHYLQTQKITPEQRKKQEAYEFAYNPSFGLPEGESDYVILAPDGTVWEENLIYECKRLLNAQPDIDIVYTDSDQIAEDGRYTNPLFKPDYNPDLLRSENYIGEACVIRRSLYDKLRPLIEPVETDEIQGDQGSVLWELYLACMEERAVFGHIQKVLCHVPEHLITSLAIRHWTCDWTEQPLVSILIPNKDHIEELHTCITSLEGKSTYRNYEILIIENNSTEEQTFEYYKKLEQTSDHIRVLYYEGEFNYSRINNFGVQQARGEYLLLLNNDTEMIHPESIWELLSHAMRPGVGIVGARLYFPDNTIQHAGVIVGYGGVAGHAFLGFAKEAPGYQNRIRCIQDYSAVTAACMMIPRTVYDEVGGLSEEYKVAFNDIDFCLKVREAGYLVVYNPYAELYHYESKSRGCDTTDEKMLRYQQEVQLFTRRWRKILLEGDPYYNRNLSLDRKDFSVK